MSDQAGAGKSFPGRLASMIYPDLDYALWRRRRRREIRSELAGSDYSELLARHPVMIQRAAERPPHVVVVPIRGEREEDSPRAVDHYYPFAAAHGNFYYEATQLLREADIDTSVLSVQPDEPAARWHARLLDHLMDTGATHLFTHAENDPESVGASFTWDRWWTMAAPRWDGVFIGTMFDSSYPWITAGSRQLARISERYVLVDICIPMNGQLVRGRPEVGPVLQPISRYTTTLLDAHLAGIEPQHDVSFIGALYPYRLELIERLRAEGVSVAVNPHRQGGDASLEESRRDQPGWLDYMAGLASSRMTINFSQSSAGPFEQLKFRVTEALMAGTLLLTDDVDRTSGYLRPDEYGFFRNLPDLQRVIEGFVADPGRLEAVRRAGAQRVRGLVHDDLWSRVDATLRRRGLPTIGYPSPGLGAGG